MRIAAIITACFLVFPPWAAQGAIEEATPAAIEQAMQTLDDCAALEKHKWEKPRIDPHVLATCAALERLQWPAFRIARARRAERENK